MQDVTLEILKRTSVVQPRKSKSRASKAAARVANCCTLAQ
jgi:hypothetical protein